MILFAAVRRLNSRETNGLGFLFEPPLKPRADPEQCCWGGARTVGGVRARRREAPSSKCDRGSAKRLPRELRQGSGGAKIGLLES